MQAAVGDLQWLSRQNEGKQAEHVLGTDAGLLVLTGIDNASIVPDLLIHCQVFKNGFSMTAR